MKFFFDNSIAAKIARGLNGFVAPDHQVVHFKDQFAVNTDDSVWMTQLAQQEEWIIISADIRVTKNPHAVEAWKAVGHTIFFLAPGWLKMRFGDQAQKFVKAFPQLIETANSAKRGSIFIVGVNGRIET